MSQVQKDARRCGDVVRNLLLFAQPSGADLGVHHLNRIIESGLSLLRHHLEMGHIHLDTHPLEGDDAIPCDMNLLQQAFVALLLDVIETMPGSGRLTVRATAADGTVRIEISNTGAGIAADTAPHPGEHGAATTGRSRGGLGLAVADAIVSQHGGSIQVESTPGNGTTFRVLLARTTSTGKPPKS